MSKATELANLALSFAIPVDPVFRVEVSQHEFEILVLAGLSNINAGIQTQAAAGNVAAVPAMVTVGTTVGGTILLAAGSTGKRVAIYNFGPQPVTFSDGGTPTATTGTAILQPGGYWERPANAISAIRGITASATATVGVTLY